MLAKCKVGAAHSLAALASVHAFMASTDTSASASARTSASTCSYQVSCVGAVIVVAVAIAAAGVNCVVFLNELTITNQTKCYEKQNLLSANCDST